MGAVVRRFIVLSSALLFAVCLQAQQAAKGTASVWGSVSGSVTCADTNAPARFAVVTLLPVPGEGAAKKAESTSSAIATTDLDGRFAMARGAGGEVFCARAAGWVSESAGCVWA